MNSLPREYSLRELKIEVTHKCPLACIHCSSDAGPDCVRELSRGKCIAITTEAASMGVHELTFSGGEPLLWDGIEEAVAHAYTQGMCVGIYTSGASPEAAANLLRLRENGLSKAAFSMFGPDTESHEWITRRRGSFEATTSTVANVSKAGLETELHFVPLARNYRCLRAVAELGKSINASRISVLRFVPQGRGQLLGRECLSRLQNIELRRIIGELRSEGYEIRTGSPYNFLMMNDNPICNAGVDRLIVTPDLRVYPCDAFKQIKAEDVSNTLQSSSLADLCLPACWKDSPYLQSVRAAVVAEPTGSCSDCTSRLKCGSGCLAQKFIYNRGLDGPDPMCLMSRKGAAE